MPDTIQAAEAALAPARPEAVGIDPARLARLTEALRREVAEGRLPGAVIAVARRGHLVLHEAMGALDPATGAPMPLDALFSIASMTKPMTGVAAVSLLEEGRLIATDPVGAYVPVFRESRVARDGGADTPIESAPARAAMTVMDAMRHTTGLVYGPQGQAPAHRAAMAAGIASSGSLAAKLDSAACAKALAALPLRFEPGTVWNYGFSTDVLGLVVEAVAGKPLGAVMRERIFAPLGMADTGYALPDGGAARFARPFAKDPLTGTAQEVAPPPAAPRMDPGGTGLVSTAADYLRVAQALLDGGILGGARILSPRGVAWMGSDHLGAGIANTVPAFDPFLAGYGFGATVAVRTLRGQGGGLASVGSFGWTGVNGTCFWVDPAERLAVVFMAHAPGDLRRRMRRLVDALLYQALDD